MSLGADVRVGTCVCARCEGGCGCLSEHVRVDICFVFVCECACVYMCVGGGVCVLSTP